MSQLAAIVTPLTGTPEAEPWVHFCSQCIERKRPCVLVTIKTAPPKAPCEPGEHFVYDGDGHGLLPRNIHFSMELHRLTQEALQTRRMHEATLPTSAGEVCVELIPHLPETT